MNHYKLVQISLLLCSTFSLNSLTAQSVTLSSSGQTGTSGTNWSVSGTNPVTISATGAASINTSVIQGYLNAGTSVIVNNPNVGTTINSNISKTAGASATLTIKDISNIKVAASVSISSSSNALDIILWADADNSQGGTVDDFSYVMAGATLSSNGGKIVLAGGLDNGANGGVSGDGIPDGFAWNGSNSTTYGANDIGGLTLGARAGTGTVVSLLSGGGEIILRGATSGNNGYPGITSQGNLKIDAGAGKITMYGKSTTGHGIELTFGAVPAIAINSSSTTVPAIDIKGTTTATGFAGFWASNNGVGNILIQSTAASNGGVLIEGTSTSANGLIIGNSGTGIISQVLSQAGTINLRGKGASNSSLLLYGDVYVGSRKDATAIQGITPAVSSATSNILLQGDDQLQFGNTSSKNTNIASSGSLTVEAYTTGYGGTLSWTGNTAIGSAFSVITLGESAENYSILLNTSLTSAGNITAYSSDFSLANGIGVASSGAGTININANGSFNTVGTTRRTISSVNGAINIYADADASGNGQLDIDYLTVNAGTGNTRMRAETLSWITTANTDKPYINGTGSFTIESADASFQDVFTQWFFFDQDANGMAGLTIGKSTNTGNISHQTNALTVAGPISLYGGYIVLDVNLTSSAAGDIFIKANTNRSGGASISGNASILKTAGSGTLTMQGGSRVNSGTITASGTGILNVVLWSDYGNNNNGGVEVDGITTNGGHLWVGGSGSAAGSYTWKGLTVGDGPSVGSVNNNYNALDFFGPLSTSGGDILIWAGTGYSGGTAGIAIQTASRSISSGTGNITLIADNIAGNDIAINSTGSLNLVPYDGSYPAAVTWSGALSAGNLNVSGTYDALLINSFANLGGLSLGYYAGQLSSGTPVLQNNTSDVTISTAISITGPITVYGNTANINQNLTSTAAGNISLYSNAPLIGASSILSSTGMLIIEPITAGTTIGLASSASITLSAANFSTNFADGFSEIRIGNNAAGNMKLGGVITVQDNLRLITSGVLLLNETLDIGVNNVRFAGSSINPAAGKYIKTNGTGKLIMDIANNVSRLFPIGAAYYNPATITNHIGATDEFYATVSPRLYYEGGISGTRIINPIRVDLTYNIGNTGSTTGSGNVDVLFKWNASDVSGSLTSPRLYHYTGTSWQPQVGSSTFDLPTQTLTYSGYTGKLTYFAIAQVNAVLPVTWLSFSGKRLQHAVELKWSTSSEQNNDYFSVERKVGSGNFTAIGQVRAAQNPGDLNEYVFNDLQPSSERSYYRIQQVDRDGQKKYSGVINISEGSAEGYTLSAMPGAQLILNTPSSVTDRQTLSIYDAGGRQVYRQKINSNRTVVSAGVLSTGGVYFATVAKGGEIVYRTRFVN